jgi:prepilin-type N-terminal cleavage/methylation domain-containing protein
MRTVRSRADLRVPSHLPNTVRKAGQLSLPGRSTGSPPRASRHAEGSGTEPYETVGSSGSQHNALPTSQRTTLFRRAWKQTRRKDKVRLLRWPSRKQTDVRRAHAFTLLELLLALALSSLILVAVGMALDLHLRSYMKRRTVIEQSQLARALLHRIAEDIRATIRYEEPDLSSYESALENVSPETLAGLDADTLSSIAGGSDDAAALGAAGTGMKGESTDSLLSELSSPNTQDLASSTSVPTVPGIYGNQYELQLDVSRLPSQEKYFSTVPADGMMFAVDMPSDIKTVTYYLQATGAPQALGPRAELDEIAPGQSAFDLLDTPDTGGLVRRELDRSITQWAITNGNVTGLQQAGTIIAPEVISLEFRYFDGTQWLTQWDTSALQSLPIAIEVLLALQPPTEASTVSALLGTPTGNATAEVSGSYYRMVVHLPTGGQAPTTQATTEETAEIDTSFSGVTP